MSNTLKLLVRESFDPIVNLDLMVDEWMYERFYHGKKCNIKRAHDSMVKTINWRLKNNISSQFPDECLNELMSGQLRFHGLDRDHRPICYFFGKLHHTSVKSSLSNFEKFIVWMIEQHYPLLERNRKQLCVVIDLKDVSFSNVNFSHIQFILNTLQTHYPELLGVVLIINSPRLFRGIWLVIRKFLKESVANKVKFCKDLNMYIDSSQLLPLELWSTPM